MVSQSENQPIGESQQQLMAVWDEMPCTYPAIPDPSKLHAISLILDHQR